MPAKLTLEYIFNTHSNNYREWLDSLEIFLERLARIIADHPQMSDARRQKLVKVGLERFEKIAEHIFSRDSFVTAHALETIVSEEQLDLGKVAAMEAAFSAVFRMAARRFCFTSITHKADFAQNSFAYKLKQHGYG